MNLKEIQQLIDMINKSDLDEATIEEGEFKITLKKNTVVPVLQSTPQPVPAPVLQSPSQASPPSAAESVSAEGDPGTEKRNGLIEIHSPIVGTFYRSPSPEADPFVNVNDQIENGHVLCIIEAMKLMNEIESDVTGTVVDILVENGQPVEYGQPLFLIRP